MKGVCLGVWGVLGTHCCLRESIECLIVICYLSISERFMLLWFEFVLPRHLIRSADGDSCGVWCVGCRLLFPCATQRFPRGAYAPVFRSICLNNIQQHEAHQHAPSSPVFRNIPPLSGQRSAPSPNNPLSILDQQPNAKPELFVTLLAAEHTIVFFAVICKALYMKFGTWVNP